MYKLKIKKYRKLKNITQKQLAIKINVSQNFLSELENQKYDIKLSTLLNISQALNVCPQDLVECNCINCSNYKKEVK